MTSQNVSCVKVLEQKTVCTNNDNKKNCDTLKRAAEVEGGWRCQSHVICTHLHSLEPCYQAQIPHPVQHRNEELMSILLVEIFEFLILD